MAITVNEVRILGNVGQDPEVRTFQNGGKVASLSVATSRQWKDRNTGERRERTEWHRVNVTADHLVGVVQDKVRKGDRVHVSGRLETRKFQDQSGADRYVTEIVVAPFEGNLVALGRPDRRDDGAGGGGGYGGGQSRPGAGAPPPDGDDEIPF